MRRFLIAFVVLVALVYLGLVMWTRYIEPAIAP